MTLFCVFFFLHYRHLLTLFRMGLFGAAHGWEWAKGPSLPIICHTYPTIMKLGAVIPYLENINKIYQSRDTLLSSADVSIFKSKISRLRYIKKY